MPKISRIFHSYNGNRNPSRIANHTRNNKKTVVREVSFEEEQQHQQHLTTSLPSSPCHAYSSFSPTIIACKRPRAYSNDYNTTTTNTVPITPNANYFCDDVATTPIITNTRYKYIDHNNNHAGEAKVVTPIFTTSSSSSPVVSSCPPCIPTCLSSKPSSCTTSNSSSSGGGSSSSGWGHFVDLLVPLDDEDAVAKGNSNIATGASRNNKCRSLKYEPYPKLRRNKKSYYYHNRSTFRLTPSKPTGSPNDRNNDKDILLLGSSSLAIVTPTGIAANHRDNTSITDGNISNGNSMEEEDTSFNNRRVNDGEDATVVAIRAFNRLHM